MDKRASGQAGQTATFAVFLALLALITACGGQKTPQVVYVTATPVQELATVVDAATPSPVVIVVTATPSPVVMVFVA